MHSSERTRLARQKARERGMCGTCCTRPALPDRKTCASCGSVRVAELAREKDAALDKAAFVSDVDVVFCDLNVNCFAVRIGEVVAVVKAGKVSEVVSRQNYARNGFKKHDLFEHLRMFG